MLWEERIQQGLLPDHPGLAAPVYLLTPVPPASPEYFFLGSGRDPLPGSWVFPREILSFGSRVGVFFAGISGLPDIAARTAGMARMAAILLRSSSYRPHPCFDRSSFGFLGRAFVQQADGCGPVRSRPATRRGVRQGIWGIQFIAGNRHLPQL